MNVWKYTAVALVMTCMPYCGGQVSEDQGAGFRAIDPGVAWRRLPLRTPQLPEWAPLLAEPLPESTAALLLLDSLHRAHNPIGTTLSGQLRWIAADAVGCDYARANAASDLLALGESREAIQALRRDDPQWTPIQRATFRFAEQVTLSASTATDAEVQALADHYGDAVVVGIVHTLAFANFQNRLFLALGVTQQGAEPVPPMDWPLDLKNGRAADAPIRPTHDELLQATSTLTPGRATIWDAVPLRELEERQRRQQVRQGRVPIPTDDALSHLTPEQLQRSGPIIWSRVSLGYQPQLTRGWFRLMEAFRGEAKLDQVFANTLFWVVTSSNECFY